MSITPFATNDLIWKTLNRADVSAVKGPVGVYLSDGKRSDDLAQIPWQGERYLTWEVIITIIWLIMHIWLPRQLLRKVLLGVQPEGKS